MKSCGTFHYAVTIPLHPPPTRSAHAQFLQITPSGARPVQEQVHPCFRLVPTGTDRHSPVSSTPAKVTAQAHSKHGAGYHLWICAGPMSHRPPPGSGNWRTPTRGMPMQCDMALSCRLLGKQIYFTHSACALTRLYSY